MKFSKFLLMFIMLIVSTSILAKVNINTASISELETLKGIGIKKAEKIIEYREKVGSFKSIEELVYVSGIGQATLEKIRDEIEVSNSRSNVKSSNSDQEKVTRDEVTLKKIEEDKITPPSNNKQLAKPDNQSSVKEKDKSSTENKK